MPLHESGVSTTKLQIEELKESQTYLQGLSKECNRTEADIVKE